jgi:hypothetical protein
MTDDLLAGLVLVSVSVGLCYLVVTDWLAERRVARENARRQDEYRQLCDQAKAFGTPPPFPPNRIVRR